MVLVQLIPTGGGTQKLGQILLVIILAGFAARIVLDTVLAIAPFVAACVVTFILVKVIWGGMRRW